MILILLLIVKRRPSHIEMASLTPARVNVEGTQSCLGKHRCVLVYLAPWCPACKGSVSGIRALAEHYRDSKRVGISAIIGGDTVSNVEMMATSLGDVAFVDHDQAFHKSAKVGSIPHWFVVNETGEILHEAHGGFHANVPVTRYMEFLKLDGD